MTRMEMTCFLKKMRSKMNKAALKKGESQVV